MRIRHGRGLGRFGLLIAFTVVMTAIGVYQVRQQYEVVARGYKVDQELFEYRRQMETKKRLSLLLSAHMDPTTLHAVAVEELGMAHPDVDHERFVPERDAPKARDLKRRGGRGEAP
jgi:cell division protein FtsL